MLPGSGGPAPEKAAGPVHVLAAAEAPPTAEADVPEPPASERPASDAQDSAAPEPEPPETPGPTAVPVLLYHHLDPATEGRDGAIISVEAFAAQMAWLREHGFTAITTAELADWLDGKGELPPRPVLITFDDGYYSNYEYAYPLLRDNGLRAALFVVTTTLGVDTAFAHVTYEDLREMAEAGVFEPQIHSYDGHRLVDGEPVLLSWTSEELQADLDLFLAGFAEAGLPTPIAYAYPFGAYSEQTLEVMRDNGIRLGLTTRPGLVERDTDPLQLPRYVIFPSTTLCQFAAIMGLPGECPAESTGSAEAPAAGGAAPADPASNDPAKPPEPPPPQRSPSPPARPKPPVQPVIPGTLVPSPQ